MAKTQFLTYYICLSDPELVAQHQATQWIPAVTIPGDIPLGVVNRAPLAAADEFAAPFRGFVDPFTPGENYIWTPWSGIGEEDGPFPLNVATFQRKTGGFWVFGGSTTRYYWMGQFVYVPAPTASVGGVPAPPEDIASVCFIDGFELPHNGEGASVFSLDTYSPDASRHLDGLGLAIRGQTGAGQRTHQWNEAGVLGANPSEAWTRFYIRLRRAPDMAFGQFWDCRTQASSTAAASLKFTSNRTLALFTIQSTVLTFHSSIPGEFELDRWYRLDILLRVGQNPPNDGRFRLYVDGELVYDIQVTTNEGLGGGGVAPRLTDCRMVVDGALNGMDLDIDDWSGHAMPNGTDPAYPDAGSFTGLDWLNGSMIPLVRPTAFGPGHGSWTGDARLLQQRPVGGVGSSVSGVLSTSSGAVMEVELDYERAVQARSGYLAMSALVVAAFHSRASGTADCILGYALDGAAFTSVNVSGGTTEGWDNQFLNRGGTGIELPDEITGPLRLRFTKSADATQVNVRALQAAPLLIGQFGPEDAPPDVDVTNLTAPVGIHNTPYPRSPWGLGGLPPLAPIAIIGGTYTGNNLAQDLLSAIPAHWYWVRPLTGGLGGTQWWSTMLAPHVQQDLAVRPDVMVRAQQVEDYDGLPGEEAQSQQYSLTPAGTFTQGNANTVVYQFIAVCDPGQRVMTNGAFMHGTGVTTYDNPLADSGFTPQLAFLFPEHLGNTTTNNLRWKGPGNAATAWQLLTGTAEQATAIEFAEGVLRSLANAHAASGSTIAYSAWRDDDGILDANGASQRGKAVQMWSYVGDGAASRTLSFPVAVGRRPLFAIVTAITAVAGVFRDPSHTTNNSCDISNTNTTTGITAGGIDQITVGSTLNTNGVTFNVFLIVGGTTAGNGGWGINETLIPMEPDTAPGDQWGPEFPGEPTEAEEEEDEPDPFDPDELTTDIAANCISASTRLCNRALSRIGITARLTSLADDDSVEADQFRLVYKGEIDATLRAFPWPFATAYADVVHQAGVDADDPVNGDWVHSYRQPSDCVFVRRIVRPDYRRTYDPDPVAFRPVSDDDRHLIFANEPGEKLPLDDTWVDEDDYTVEIEYTRRVDCPASRGDAVFRSCAAWRLAAAVAMALGKDEKVVKWCLSNFLAELPATKVISSNEQVHQDSGNGDPDWIRGR